MSINQDQTPKRVAHRAAAAMFHRLVIDETGRCVVWTLAIALLIIVGSRIIGWESASRLWWGWIVLAIFVAFGIGFVRAFQLRLSDKQSGGILDERLGLKGQIRSAIEFETQTIDQVSAGFVELSIAQASKAAQHVDIQDAIDTPDAKAWWRAAIILILIVVVGIWVPLRAPGSGPVPSSIPIAAIESIDHAQELIEEVQSVNESEESPKVQRAIEEINELKEELANGVNDSEQAETLAAAKLEQLADALEEESQQQEQEAREISERIAEAQNRALNEPSDELDQQGAWDELVDQLANEIQDQDFEEAQRLIEDIEQQMNGMDESQREELEQQLEELADAIEPDQAEMSEDVDKEDQESTESKKKEPPSSDPSSDEQSQSEQSEQTKENSQEESPKSNEDNSLNQDSKEESTDRETEENTGNQESDQSQEQSKDGTQQEKKSGQQSKDSEPKEQSQDGSKEQSGEQSNDSNSQESTSEQESVEEDRDSDSNGKQQERAVREGSNESQESGDLRESSQDQQSENPSEDQIRSLKERLDEMESKKNQSQRRNEQAQDIRDEAQRLIQDPQQPEEDTDQRESNGESNPQDIEDLQSRGTGSRGSDKEISENTIKDDFESDPEYVPFDAADQNVDPSNDPVGKWYAPDGDTQAPQQSGIAAERFRQASKKAQKAIEQQQVPRKYRKVVKEAFQRVQDRADSLESSNQSGSKVAPQGKDAVSKNDNPKSTKESDK